MSHVFSVLSILRRHLSHNQLKVIEQSYFDGLDRLETLSLSGNVIVSIETGTFKNLTALKGL